jgi:Ca-activated chloride channel family protein
VVGRLLVILLAIGVVGVSFAASRGDEGSGGAKPTPTASATPTAAPGGTLHLDFVYSTEKVRLIKPLVDAFNASHPTSDGRPLRVDGRAIASGDVEQEIAAGRLQPVIWSPASSLWARLLNFETDRALTPRTSPSIVRTPLVIAMWEPMARALGWPRKPIGFSDLLRLARSKRGWAAFGRPEFGPFRLVHTNPDFSTSGLSAVVAEYAAETGGRHALTEADIRRARPAVRDLERSITHYGDTTPFVAQQMQAEGPAYASAAAMEEVTLLDFNRTRGSADRLVAIYPSEGTFYSDNPFIVLNAPWVDDAEHRAAAVFHRFVMAHVGPADAARFNFRPATGGPPQDSPISTAAGADPSEPKRVLDLPTSRVLDAIRRAWRLDRKPADILLAVDISDSMNEESRLQRAKAGLNAFLGTIEPQDRVGLLAFSDVVTPLVPVQPLRLNGARLRRTVDGLVTNGGTSLYDAVDASVQRVEALASRDRIEAVVVLSDGQDLNSQLVLNDLTKRLESHAEAATRVRVYAIAYSADAAGARDALDKIAAATGGKVFEGGTQNIESVYRQIASFF